MSVFRDLRNAIRVSRPLTAVVGPEFRTSSDLIEIDITYRCNLKCYNCDRSCTQAPDTVDMTLVQLERFVDETRIMSRKWKRIRIMGGEPLLHPNVEEILEIFADFRRENSETLIEVITNGYGEIVRKAMRKIPPMITLKNTNKTKRFQRKFEPFNLAPIDKRRHILTDFSNGCWITEECGIGLNAYGYYPCGVGGSIDRVFGFDIGRKELPSENDPMTDQKRKLCPLCGHFANRRFIPIAEREAVLGEPKSKSWIEAYKRHKKAPPVLTKY